MSLTVTTETFRGFIDDQRRKIADTFREVEQVQAQYQGTYTSFKSDHDRTLAALADAVEAQGDALDASLRAQIEARVPAERQALADQIASLEKELAGLRDAADATIQHVQQQMAEVRTLNPQLNDQEESLKAKVARREADLNDLNAQVRARGRGLGFIIHVGRIHALDRERHRVLGQLQALTAQLGEVRKQWQDRQATLAKLQAESRSEWETTTARIGQLQQEQDYLAQNTEALVQRHAVVFVLDNLKTPAWATSAALNDQLQQMVALNVQTDDFQAALGAVAGILGLLKGVDEGLQRFSQSVSALSDEQARHSQFLSPLRIELADSVTAFGATWDDLVAQVRDEKALADHPAEFVVAMKPFLDERLTAARIGGFFDEMGQAIQRATASWRG